MAYVVVWLMAHMMAWFMAYVMLVPRLGYLPSTILFTLTLAFRLGYRDFRHLSGAVGVGIAIVVIFKSFLQVKVPGGLLYERFPDTIRAFMLTYL